MENDKKIKNSDAIYHQNPRRKRDGSALSFIANTIKSTVDCALPRNATNYNMNKKIKELDELNKEENDKISKIKKSVNNEKDAPLYCSNNEDTINNNNNLSNYESSTDDDSVMLLEFEGKLKHILLLNLKSKFYKKQPKYSENINVVEFICSLLDKKLMKNEKKEEEIIEEPTTHNNNLIQKSPSNTNNDNTVGDKKEKKRKIFQNRYTYQNFERIGRYYKRNYYENNAGYENKKKREKNHRIDPNNKNENYNENKKLGSEYKKYLYDRLMNFKEIPDIILEHSPYENCESFTQITVMQSDRFLEKMKSKKNELDLTNYDKIVVIADEICVQEEVNEHYLDYEFTNIIKSDLHHYFFKNILMNTYLGNSSKNKDILGHLTDYLNKFKKSNQNVTNSEDNFKNIIFDTDFLPEDVKLSHNSNSKVSKNNNLIEEEYNSDGEILNNKLNKNLKVYRKNNDHYCMSRKILIDDPVKNKQESDSKIRNTNQSNNKKNMSDINSKIKPYVINSKNYFSNSYIICGGNILNNSNKLDNEEIKLKNNNETDELVNYKEISELEIMNELESNLLNYSTDVGKILSIIEKYYNLNNRYMMKNSVNEYKIKLNNENEKNHNSTSTDKTKEFINDNDFYYQKDVNDNNNYEYNEYYKSYIQNMDLYKLLTTIRKLLISNNFLVKKMLNIQKSDISKNLNKLPHFKFTLLNIESIENVIQNMENNLINNDSNDENLMNKNKPVHTKCQTLDFYIYHQTFKNPEIFHILNDKDNGIINNGNKNKNDNKFKKIIERIKYELRNDIYKSNDYLHKILLTRVNDFFIENNCIDFHKKYQYLIHKSSQTSNELKKLNTIKSKLMKRDEIDDYLNDNKKFEPVVLKNDIYYFVNHKIVNKTRKSFFINHNKEEMKIKPNHNSKKKEDKNHKKIDENNKDNFRYLGTQYKHKILKVCTNPNHIDKIIKNENNNNLNVENESDNEDIEKQQQEQEINKKYKLFIQTERIKIKKEENNKKSNEKMKTENEFFLERDNKNDLDSLHKKNYENNHQLCELIYYLFQYEKDKEVSKIINGKRNGKIEQKILSK
jgi:hypothetical protein